MAISENNLNGNNYSLLSFQEPEVVFLTLCCCVHWQFATEFCCDDWLCRNSRNSQSAIPPDTMNLSSRAIIWAAVLPFSSMASLLAPLSKSSCSAL